MTITLVHQDVLAALVWTAVAFTAGVAYAAYRALSWVDRIRTWAHALPPEDVQLLGGPACGGCASDHQRNIDTEGNST